MAVLRVNRAKKLIASGLNDRLNYMALYQHDFPIEVGQKLYLTDPDGKSDNSPFRVKLNKVEGLDKYKVINDFSQIEWGGQTVEGLDRIMNFFIAHNFSASRIVITDGRNGNVTAQVQFPTITPTNGEDENFLINVFEILID